MAELSGIQVRGGAATRRPAAPGPLARASAPVLGAVRGASAAAGVVGRAARTLCTPTGLAGIAVESAWCAAHLAFYPWGAMAERRREDHEYGLSGLSPTQRGLLISDVEAAGTPILLVHGMVDNRSIFTVLRRGLRRRGFGRVLTTNYSLLTNDVRSAAERLAGEVEELVADSGYERIHIIGHSLGGLIARYYVQRLGGHERVDTLVTMGTPHQGTLTAYLWPAELGRQLRPGSTLMAELAEPAPGCTTRLLCYWSDLDQMIVPKRNARVAHDGLLVRNQLVRGVGHMSLPIQNRLVHEITTALSQLNTDGSTQTAGVTPLRSPRGG